MNPTLRPRLGEVVAIACAVFVGAVLVTASLVMAETGFRSHLPAHRLASADLVVSARQSVPVDQDLDVALPDRAPVAAGITHRVAAVDGVAAASADISFSATLVGADGKPVADSDVTHNGHNWARILLPDKGINGHAPHGPSEIALSQSDASAAGAKVGTRVDAVLDGHTRSMTVTAIVPGSAPGLYVDSATARSLSSHPGAIDLVAVRVTEGANVSTVSDRVRETLAGTGLIVSNGDELGDVENLGAAAGSADLITFAASGGGVIVLLVGFLVAGAVTISVTNRARELALLRAIGATPRQVRSMVAQQSSRIALMAIAGGVLGGYLLARPLLDVMADNGVVSSELPVAWSPVPAVITAVLLLGVVRGAARMSSWRISRASATRAVADTQTEPASGGVLRTRIGIALLVLPIAASLVPLFVRNDIALISASSGILVAMIGLSMAAPALMRSLGSRLSERISARQGPVSRWLAVNNSGAYALRTGGALAVLALAIALTMTQLFVASTLTAAASHDRSAATHATAVVTADAIGGVNPQALAAIQRTPGVTAAVPMSGTTVVLTGMSDGARTAEAFPATALGHDAPAALDLGVTHGDLHRLAGDTAALDSFTASSKGIDIGHRFPVILADGAVIHPKLVATYDRSFGFGKVVLSSDILAMHGHRSYDSVLVTSRVDPTSLVSTLKMAVHGTVGAEVTAAPLPAAAVSTEEPGQNISLALTLVLMGYVLLGVANRLVATTARRRKEWETLRAIGATPAQVRRMVRVESGLIVGGAIVAGLLISLVPMTFISIGLVGEPWPQGSAWPVALTCLVVGGTAYAATMLTTRRTLRSIAT